MDKQVAQWMSMDLLRMTTTQWVPWDYTFVFLGHGIVRMTMGSEWCVQRMWTDFLADDFVPNGKFGIPLAYTPSTWCSQLLSVFLTLAPLDIFVGKLKTTHAHLPISLSG
jgi:hypothetical protein